MRICGRAFGYREAKVSFVNRIADKIRESTEVVIMMADSKWGGPYIFDELSRTEPLCIWLHLGLEDAKDAIAQGNGLSNAVTKALGSQLFGQGMDYGYGLSLLKQHLALFEPLTFILSGAHYGQGLAYELMNLQRPGTKVVLAFEELPDQFLIPEKALVLLEDHLKLTDDEALELAVGRLNDVETLNLRRLYKGAYESFMLALHAKLSLPPKLRPGPDRAELPPEAQPSINPSVLLGVLERREQHLEALEVACDHLPERVPEMLARGGEAYLDRGLYERLWQLLSRLPESLQQDEQVLTWQALSARRLGRHQDLRPRIEAYLQTNEAPNLRAIYASFIPRKAGFEQVKRAHQAAKTLITLQHYGLALAYRDPEAALDVFKELIDLAKREGTPSQQVRAEMMMGLPLIFLSRYREAAVWLEQALNAFDKHGVGDWQARIHMLNNWAYIRILIGETVGLSDMLENQAKALGDIYPARTVNFRATLGDYLISQGQPEAALDYYEENLQILEASQNTKVIDFPPNIVRDIVHCLLHLGDKERAAVIANKYYYLSREAEGFERAYGSLAQGMVWALSAPKDALAPLSEAVERLEQAHMGDHFVSASLYLAKAYLDLGDESAARAVLGRCENNLNQLSEIGLRMLAGPEAAFQKVLSLVRGSETPLVMTFLGNERVTCDGTPLELFPQWLEVLALLALHPNGLSGERLLIHLYGDAGKLSTLKGVLSKIRRHIPLTRPPYRIDIPFKADFIEIDEHLRSGRVRAALELYRGDLLPFSEAEGVVQARETLEESLRQGVLTSGDPEALMSLAEHLVDDLELWEAALDALPTGDPRTSVASAKHKKLLETW